MLQIRTIIVLLLSLNLFACAWMPEDEDETTGWSASRLYNAAKSAVNASEYENAIRYYETLESRFPFGKYAKQGQIEIAYAYYKYDEPESAIAAADRFIKLHPNHPHVDYAHYLKGLIYFNREIGLLGRIFQQDSTTRDPSSARKAFEEFTALLNKFPKSQYAGDARLRALYLRNGLAHHEIHVAGYYLRRQAYNAAINRAKYVIENFEQSSAVPDALIIMAQAYDELGLTTLATDARRVLQASFPDHDKISKKKKSWWNPF